MIKAGQLAKIFASACSLQGVWLSSSSIARALFTGLALTGKECMAGVFTALLPRDEGQPQPDDADQSSLALVAFDARCANKPMPAQPYGQTLTLHLNSEFRTKTDQ